jgi:hypothetical protein
MALTNRQERTLRKALYDCLTPTDDSQGEMALRSTRQEIPQNHELLALTCSMAAKKMLGKDIPRSEIAVSPTALTDNDYRVDSNLQSKFHLGQLDSHRVIESGILAIAQRNDRIEQMQRHSALSGFSEDELPVFGEKLSFLEESLSPEAHERRIRRVIELRGLPRIPSDQPISIDAKRILELRESPECIQFRRWLSSTDDISDEEISSLSTSVISRIGGFIRTGAGRVMRFLVTTGAGVIPPLGLPLSAADQFLLERIFPSPGPIAFVDTIYPSLFKAPEE